MSWTTILGIIIGVILFPFVLYTTAKLIGHAVAAGYDRYHHEKQRKNDGRPPKV